VYDCVISILRCWRQKPLDHWNYVGDIIYPWSLCKNFSLC